MILKTGRTPFIWRIFRILVNKFTRGRRSLIHSIIFLSFRIAFIHFVCLTFTESPSFTIPKTFLSNFFPKKSPYRGTLFEMNFTRLEAEENANYFMKRNTMQRSDLESRKLPPTSRLNLPWMSAREQIRVEFATRNGN